MDYHNLSYEQNKIIKSHLTNNHIGIGKWETANKISPNVMNIHDVIIIILIGAQIECFRMLQQKSNDKIDNARCTGLQFKWWYY